MNPMVLYSMSLKSSILYFIMLLTAINVRTWNGLNCSHLEYEPNVAWEDMADLKWVALRHVIYKGGQVLDPSRCRVLVELKESDWEEERCCENHGENSERLHDCICLLSSTPPKVSDLRLSLAKVRLCPSPYLSLLVLLGKRYSKSRDMSNVT
jgi:hypothetical protein